VRARTKPRPAAPIPPQDHATIAHLAAECAEQVLPFFDRKNADDDRPRKAIEAARAWARGAIPCGVARAAALAAHAAAREITDAAAIAAARSAGHAAATAHVASHARAAVAYAKNALEAAVPPRQNSRLVSR
jgi:hypothetical protein